MGERFCPAMFETLADGRFMGDIHEVGSDGRYATTPIVGGGAVRILMCRMHADEVWNRHNPRGTADGEIPR